MHSNIQMSSVASQFSHQNFSRCESGEKGCHLSTDEYVLYIQTIEHHVQLLRNQAEQNLEAAVVTVQNFINVFIPDTEVPHDVLAPCVPVLFHVMSNVISVPAALDATFWLMARMLLYCNDLDTDVRECDGVLYSMFDAIEEHKCFHLIDLMVNLFRRKAMTINASFWKCLARHIALMSIGGSVSRSYIILVKIATRHCSCVESDEEESEWTTFICNIMNAIPQMTGDPETMRQAMLMFADICKYTLRRGLTADTILKTKFPQMCELVGQCAPIAELAEPGFRMFYWIIARAIYNNDVAVDQSMIPYQAIITAVTTKDEHYAAAQFEAIQLLRILCELFPPALAMGNIFPIIIELYEDSPYRIQFQVIWIIAQFLFKPDVETLSVCAGAAGQAPLDFIVMLLRFIIERADSEVSIAYQVLWAIKGLQWWFARYQMDDFEKVAEAVGIDEFIETCQDIDDDELSEAIDAYYQVGRTSAGNAAEIQKQLMTVLELEKSLEQKQQSSSE